jgi:hypothetical protein
VSRAKNILSKVSEDKSLAAIWTDRQGNETVLASDGKKVWSYIPRDKKTSGLPSALSNLAFKISSDDANGNQAQDALVKKSTLDAYKKAKGDVKKFASELSKAPMDLQFKPL